MSREPLPKAGCNRLPALHVRHAPGRLRALRANPSVAVTTDTETFRPDLRDEAAAAWLEQIDRPGTRMARIDLRPTWVGVHDLGGIARE